MVEKFKTLFSRILSMLATIGLWVLLVFIKLLNYSLTITNLLFISNLLIRTFHLFPNCFIYKYDFSVTKTIIGIGVLLIINGILCFVEHNIIENINYPKIFIKI